MVEQSPLTDTSRRSIKESLSCITQLANIYGFQGNPDLSVSQKHWEELAMAAHGDWMKVAKYKLAAFYTAHHGLTLPKPPFEGVADRPDYLVGGALGRFFRTKINCSNPLEREELLQSIKMLKKGFPRPDEVILRIKEKEFLEKMTTEVDQSVGSRFLVAWADMDDYPQDVNAVLTKQSIKDELVRTVKEIFGDVTYTYQARLEAFFPSTSANYINSRSQAGAVGTLLESGLLDGLRTKGGLLTVREKKREEEEMESPEIGIRKYEVLSEDTELKAKFQILWHRLIKKASEEEPLVKPVALPEALKVRMITKGPPFQQTVLHSLWKFIHSTLRGHRTFQLIGKPVTEEIILNVLGRNLKTGEKYLSGDYEAATDNLKSWVSETIAEALAVELKLSEIERSLLIRSLTGHVFENGKRQVRGQLMGSITSFPVLCLANAALCRWAMELASKKKILLRDAPLLVNGDDCAMRGTENLYRFWHTITDAAGLTESIGKTYFTREFVDINSTSFLREVEPHNVVTASGKIRPSYLRLTRYVNLGLLKGLKRSGVKTGAISEAVGLIDLTEACNNVGARARDLIDNTPERLVESAMKVFINYHKELLDRVHLPWYIPEWLGGLGIPAGPWGRPSDLDLRIARRLLLKWKTERPIPTNTKETPWRIWKEASKRLPEPVYSRVKGPATEEYNHLVSQKCVDLLFDSSITIEQLYELTDIRKQTLLLRHNERLWKPTHGGLPRPLNEQDLQFCALYPNFTLSHPPPHVTKEISKDQALCVILD